MLVRARLMTSAFALASVTLMGFPLSAAAAIGPYTLPFFKYRTMTQDYGHPANVSPLEPPGHGFTHWHTGIDWSMPIGSNLAASRIGTVSKVKEDLYDGDGPDQFGQGNFVFVRHATTSPTRWSLYYHITHNGSLFAKDDQVSAGQLIALSGNTGTSTDPHLHYSLMDTADCQTSPCDVDPRQWTTNPGRIPFEATYFSRSASGVIVVPRLRNYGSYWVAFKNTGGLTWTQVNDTRGNGKIVLRATGSGGAAAVNSLFQAADWESASTVTVADSTSVAPDDVATFTFGLWGGAAQGSQTINYFNLNAWNLKWFDFDTLGNFNIQISCE
jgi:murein DD-endopeptidase MepM/ murein hydrolase activator NlpD